MESKHGRIHYCLGAFLTLERLGKLRCLLWRWAQLRCGVESVSPVCVESGVKTLIKHINARDNKKQATLIRYNQLNVRAPNF
jgi:hypothetical protein